MNDLLHLDANTIGKVLRKRRKDINMTKEELAQGVSVNLEVIDNLEGGKNVSSHVLFDVIAYLRLSFDLWRVGRYRLPIPNIYTPLIDINMTDSKDSLESPELLFNLADKFNFPYDWSNPGHMPDNVLIMCVLKRLRFMDIVRLVKRFGVERIDREIQRPFYEDFREDLLEVMDTIHEAISSQSKEM
jgi:transcriptional regulator with XRE-family HTH domain